MADHADHSGHAAHAAPHNDSPRWLYIGIIVSLLIGAAIGLLVSIYLSYTFPTDEYDLLDGYTTYVGGFIALVVAAVIFFGGLHRLFVGQTGYWMWLGDPAPFKANRLGPGYLWGLPIFMSLEIRSSEAVDVKTGDQASATGDGLETEWSADSTYKVINLEEFEANITEAGTPNFVQGVFIEAMRKSITGLKVSEDEEFSLANITLEEATNLARNIAKFKTAVKNNGDEIRRIANEKLVPMGLQLGTVQVTNIKATGEIEKQIQEIVNEALQNATLTRDARNKTSVADEFVKNFKQQMGDAAWNALSPDRKAELIEGSQEMAMANEGKATIKSERWRGRQPTGIYTN